MSLVCVVVCVVRSHVEVVRRSECTDSRIVGFVVLREFSVCSRGGGAHAYCDVVVS